MKKSLKVFLIVTVSLITFIAGNTFLKKSVCTLEQGWIGKTQTCDCRGYEMQVVNTLPVDGIRKTFCIGQIKSTAYIQHTPEKPSEKMSTPELIDKDYKSGNITLEEKSLYIMYALHHEKYQHKLPQKYKSTVGWRGTEYLFELEEMNQSGLLCSFSKQTIQELEQGYNRSFDCP